MGMYRSLLELEKNGNSIRVALVGTGAMGMGLALQIRETPGLALVAIADIEVAKAKSAAALYGAAPFSWHRRKNYAPDDLWIGRDIIPYLKSMGEKVDVLVEATSTISYAAAACMAALEKKINVVLMNAEVDALLGPFLPYMASRTGAMITSDAGDQHGVIMRMHEEISMWGFRIVMAGNIKGVFEPCATAPRAG